MNIYIVDTAAYALAKHKFERLSSNWFSRIWYFRVIKALVAALAAYEERVARLAREEKVLADKREALAKSRRDKMHVVTKNGVRTNREEGDFDVEDDDAVAEIVTELFEEVIEDTVTCIDTDWLDKVNADLDAAEKEDTEEDSTWTDGREGLEEAIEEHLEQLAEEDPEGRLITMGDTTSSVTELEDNLLKAIDNLEAEMNSIHKPSKIGSDIDLDAVEKSIDEDLEKEFGSFGDTVGTANIDDEGLLVPEKVLEVVKEEPIAFEPTSEMVRDYTEGAKEVNSTKVEHEIVEASTVEPTVETYSYSDSSSGSDSSSSDSGSCD